MQVYIKKAEDFSTSGHYETNDYTLYLATATDQKGTVVIPEEIPDVSGDWLIADGKVFCISSSTPEDGKTTVSIADPVDFFNRDLFFKEEEAKQTAGEFIAGAIVAYWINQPDSAYRYAYLTVTSTSSVAFFAPEDDDGVFNLAEYIKTAVNAGMKITFSVSGGEIAIAMSNAGRANHTVYLTDGSSQLISSTFASSSIAKVTIRKPEPIPEESEETSEEEQEQTYSDTDFYLAEDGSVSTTPPTNRATGRWMIVVCNQEDVPMEKAQEIFDKNERSYKIEFWSSREYELFDSVTIRLPSGNFTAIISEIRSSSDDSRFYYSCGQKTTTVSETVTAVNNIVSGAAISNSTALAAYPVGSIYITTVNVSPAALFGGTWRQIKDRFLLAAGSAYAAGSTGGEATHTLTLSEIPSHSHSGLNTSGSQYARGTGGSYSNGSTGNAGGGAAHNNMPPYLAVYVYERIG